MKTAILMPFGDYGHIDRLLTELKKLARDGGEQQFVLVLPSSHLLYQYQNQLVNKVARPLSVTSFDDLVTSAMRETAIQQISTPIAGEIVTSILHQGNFPYLGQLAARDCAQDLVYTMGQLRRQKITPQAIESVQDPLLQDFGQVWRAYEDFLSQRQLADLERMYHLAPELLANTPGLSNLKRVDVCWFFDFQPIQLDVLTALSSVANSTRVHLPYSSNAHQNYIQQTLTALKERGFTINTGQGQSANDATAKLFLFSHDKQRDLNIQGLAAPRLEQEIELVIRQIKQLVVQGTDPSSLAVVVPDPRYLPRLTKVFRQHNVDISLPSVIKLASVPWVQELLALWQAAAGGWQSQNLLGIIKSKYITTHLPADYDGDAVEWALLELGRGLRIAQLLDRLDQEITRLKRIIPSMPQWLSKEHRRRLDTYSRALPGLQAWHQLAKQIQGGKTAIEHSQLMQKLVKPVTATDTDDDVDNRDWLAWQRFVTTLVQHNASLKLSGQDGSVAAADFAADIKPWLAQDFPLERGKAHGVQVLAPGQIRGLRFDYVFILGLNQGVFPKFVQPHWLLSRLQHHVSGLRDPAATALAQDKIYFHCCMAAAQQGVVLSRQLPDSEQQAEISSFWRAATSMVTDMPVLQLASNDLLPPLDANAVTSRQQLQRGLIYNAAREDVHPAFAWLQAQPQYGALAWSSAVEQRRESPLPPDNMDGTLSQPGLKVADKPLYSISRLEQYIRCPFSYFARYVLGLEAAPGDLPQYSALDRGTLLHWLLEQYYRQHLNADPQSTRQLLWKLALDWLGQQGKSGSLWQLRARDAVNAVNALVAADVRWRRQTGLRPVLLEASFGLPDSSVGAVYPNGGNVGFRGKIDRIDVLERGDETWAVVYDYKSGQHVTKGPILAGRSLQIPVYLEAAPLLLAALGYKNVRVVGGGYYVIDKASLSGGIWDKEFTGLVKSGLGSTTSDEFVQLGQQLSQASSQLHQGIADGNFSPNPQSGACRWCDFVSCCRYDKNRFQLKERGE